MPGRNLSGGRYRHGSCRPRMARRCLPICPAAGCGGCGGSGWVRAWPCWLAWSWWRSACWAGRESRSRGVAATRALSRERRAPPARRGLPQPAQRQRACPAGTRPAGPAPRHPRGRL